MSDWSSDVCSSDLVELKHPAHDIVGEVAVVGNKDDVAGVIDEVIFQPLHAFSVKMVGRFVKQQNVRLFQQQTAKRDAALFTARKRSHVRIARRAAQRDRKSVVWGKSVSVRVGSGGSRIMNKKKKTKPQH